MAGERSMNKTAHNGYQFLDFETAGHIDESSHNMSQSLEAKEMDVDNVLNELNLGYFHYRLLLICGLSYMADAVEIGFLSYASLCIKDEWNLTTFETASITACLFLGSLVGNLFVWQYIADTYGRRPACILGNFMVLFFGVSTIAAPNFIVLLIILFVAGVGVGSVFIPFDLLAEYLPAKQRGNFLTNINYFWTAGSLFVSSAAWCVISKGGWRALAVVVAIPVLLSLVLTICFLPESPRWLMLKGKTVIARHVLLQVASVNKTTLPSFYFPEQQSSAQGCAEDAPGHVWVEILSSPQYRGITVKLMLLSFAWGLSYYAVVLLISRMYSANQEGDHVDGLTFNYVDIFLNALCELVGICLTARIIDRLGRQKSQAWLYGVGALSHVLTSVFYDVEMARNILSAVSRICIIGGCSVTVVMTPELYPTSMRVGGHALANCASRIGSIAAPFLAQNMSLSVATIGFVLAVVDVSAAVLSVTLPETAGRALEGPGEQSAADVVEEIVRGGGESSAKRTEEKL